MTPEHTYDLLMQVGLGKVYAPRRIREIAALIAADSQAHSYPQMTDWIGAHGDQLVREADRRGLPTLDALLTLMLDDVFAIYVDETDDEIAEDNPTGDDLDADGDEEQYDAFDAQGSDQAELRVITRQEAEAQGMGIAANGGVDGFREAHGIPEPITADVEDQFKVRLAQLLKVPTNQLLNNGNFYYHDRIRHLFYSPTSAGGWVVDGPTPGDGLPINPGVQAFVERTRQGWHLPAHPPVSTSLPLIPPTRGPWASR